MLFQPAREEEEKNWIYFNTFLGKEDVIKCAYLKMLKIKLHPLNENN